MNKLHFDYCMQLDYAVEVSKCNYTIKCIPQNNARQTIERMKIELYPDTPYHEGVDGLRNRQIYGANDEPHLSFTFRITGEVLAGNADYEERADEDIAMIFSHPHGLNIAGEDIRKYYEKIRKEIGAIIRLDRDTQADNLLLAKVIMHYLHNDFHYQTNSTNVNTSAEEAFALGHGVCQDYAHIFIALLHLVKIPARYVTGLIVGEGASHAWVEVLHNGKWYGLDPTNDVAVSDEHIKIGIGRDAHDCMINRGIMHGGGCHKQTVHANVEIMGEK